MKTLLPSLLDYSFFAPFFLRLFVAYFFAQTGRQREKGLYGYMSVGHYLTALLLLCGAFIQAAALLGLCLNLVEYLVRKKEGVLNSDRHMLHTAVKIILISLLVLGPGPFSIDLPL